MNAEREFLPSASFVPIAANCPGAWSLCLTCPKEEGTKVTEQGIDIHAALETESYDELPPDEKEIALRLKEQEQMAKDAWLQDVFCGDSVQEIREQRLWIRDRKTFKLLASAKVDVAFVHGDAACALDFKSGFAEMTPSELNWQFKAQAVAIWHEFPEVTRVRAGGVASRLRDKTDLADYDLAALKAAEWEILRVLDKANAPDAPRFPGAHCRYCRAKPFCREHVSWSTLDVQSFKMDDELGVALAVSRLSPAAAARIYTKASVIKVLLESIKHRLLSMSDDELAAVGLKKEEGDSRRVVEKPDVVIAKLCESMKPEELCKRLKPKIGEIDAIVSEIHGIKKKDAKAKVKELFGDAIVEKQNAPSVVEIT